MTHDDRRREPRIPLLLKAKLAHDGAERALHTGNVSGTGAFISTQEPLPVGTLVAVELSFPGLLQPRELRGTVRWQRLPKSPGVYDEEAGFGVEWLDVPDDDEIRRALAGDAPRAPAGRPRYRVLLANDNPHLITVLRSGLERRRSFAGKAEFDVVTATDGRQAWEHICTGDIDLVILDAYMPVIDGIGIIERVRADARIAALPILVVSAGDEDVRAAVLDAGADFFLPKPLRLVDVLDTVGTLLRLGV